MTATRYETKTVFDYPWKQVVQAYWNRYPNPSSTHVLTEDTISREVRDGKLYSRRILSKTNPVPRWGERFCKNSTVKILEDSILDPAKKTLTTFTRNIGYIKIMRVDEIVEYSEQKDGKTLAVRTAFISSQVFGFSRAIRAFGVERFKSNCNKAAIGFNHVLRKMYPQTVSMLTSSDQIGGSINQLQQQQHQHHHSGKKDALKRAGQATYEYFKAHAGKLAQMFSVKN